MTSQPAYGLTHAYRVGDVTGITSYPKAIRLASELDISLLDIRFEPYDWTSN